MTSSAKTDRRSRQGIESRQRIMNATRELATELGYTATSIAKVSERSGLPASSVYWHFTNKDALFAAVIDDSFDGWLASMPEWIPPDPGEYRSPDDVRALAADRIRSAVASIATNPHFWRLGLMLSLEHQPVEPTARQRFVEIRARVLDDLAGFWHHVLTDGPESQVEDRCRLLARFTMATADGLFIAAQTEGDDDLDRLADLLAVSVTAAALADLV